MIVTGSSKGIGARTAVEFAKEGFDVCVNYNSDIDGAARVVDMCQALGSNALAVRANIADRSAVKKMFKKCDQFFGRFSCLVNNAGIIGQSTSIAEVTEDILTKTFATNLFGTVYCLQEAVARMATDSGGAGGSIINISSLAASIGSPGEYVHYAASKGAVETLTVGAGKELGHLGIRVNAIRVGTADTEIHVREGNPDRPAIVASTTPLGRIAQPEDVANAAVWLASPKPKFISGTVITVAGGLAP